MKTFPIYQAQFSGSDDHMAHVKLCVAAVNLQQAIRRFREWDEGSTGLMGVVGCLIHFEEGHWFRPCEIGPEHVTRLRELRATNPKYHSIQ